MGLSLLLDTKCNLVAAGETEHQGGTADEVIPWKIREQKNWGAVEDISRNNSTLQKDWAILRSHQLPSAISFAVGPIKAGIKTTKKYPMLW
ncbi:MAG: hypothetical protein PF517_19490 [Salinivirgaceae bacterium]|nr:hypothetical protein [Salinivirgaceae bacterium]